jgi:integrase
VKIKNAKIYSLSDGRYVVSYFDPARRKRVQKNFEEESKAKSFLSDLKTPTAKLNELDYLKFASTDTAIRIYLEQVPNSYLSKSGKLIREFLDFFNAHGVPRLTETNLRSFFIHYKNEFDLSDRSLLVSKSRLQGFFKFLITNGAIEASPLDGIKFNRGAPYKRKPILFEEQKIYEFIEAAKRLSPALFYPIFLLVHETAAKTSDILALHWKDLSFKVCKVDLVRSSELQPRSFNASDKLLQSIRQIDRVSDYVFTNLEGQPLKKYILGRELKRFQRQAGFLTIWGLRDLRASYSANFLRQGGSIKDLQNIMGHKQPYTTDGICSRYETLRSKLFGSVAVQETGTVSLSQTEF